ncbi:MAG TPA: outer membrane beta-barrel protein [Bradyrhizobium sp.]|jgi:opacity protein-like surface antigen
MRSVKFLIAAGAASLLSSAAFAADMPSIMPPPAYAPPPVADFGGWYLRGDIGMTNQSLKDLTLATAPFPAGFQNTGFGFDSSTSYDLGVGYRFNNWFRVDATGEYRGRANFHGSQFSPFNVIAPGFAETDNYSGSKSEWVAMANAYVDLGTWWCVTPFIGAGIGASRNTISGFRDDGVILNGGTIGPASTFAGDGSKWNFAWALHAGLAYEVTPGFTVELAYRYINLGDGITGPTNSFDGVTVVNGSGFVMKDITSQDVKLGVRWELMSPPVYAPPPLVTKG